MQMMMRRFDGSGHFNQSVLKAAISTFMKKKITDLSGKPLQNRIIYALTNNDGQLVLDFRKFNHSEGKTAFMQFWKTVKSLNREYKKTLTCGEKIIICLLRLLPLQSQFYIGEHFPP